MSAAGRTPDPERPKRSLGQNFLQDPRISRRIVESLGVRAGDTILEIGPGRGALTRPLLETGHPLVLVEKDDALAARWWERTRDRDDVRVVHGDILETDLATAGDPAHLRVIGNIPYNITSPILFHVLSRPRPREIVLMVQREVGDRIVADAGTREYGALSVGVQVVAHAERLFAVPRGAFHPRPRVDSAVLRITPRRPAPLAPEVEAAVRELTRAVFGWRRKKLRTVLRDHPDLALGRTGAEDLLQRTGLDGDARGEVLAPSEFVHLAEESGRVRSAETR